MAREEVGFWACNFRNAGLLTGHVHDEEVHWSLFDRGKGRVPGPLCPQVGVAVSRPAGFGVHNLQVTGRVFITLMTSHLAVLDTLCVDWNRLIQPFTHFFSTYYPWLFSMKYEVPSLPADCPKNIPLAPPWHRFLPGSPIWRNWSRGPNGIGAGSGSAPLRLALMMTLPQKVRHSVIGFSKVLFF